MKLFAAGLLAHYQQPTTTLAQGWLVVRKDLLEFGWCDHDVDCTIEGVLFRASEGLQTTAAHTTSAFAVDTLDVRAFLDVSTEQEIELGIWDNAQITAFEYNWADVPAVLDDRVNILLDGNLGKIQRKQNSFVATVNALSQRLATRTGTQYSKICPWRHAIWDGTTFVSSVECGVDLAAGNFIHDGTITTLGTDPNLSFFDIGSSQAAAYYDEGFMAMTSGPNSGFIREIRRWSNHLFEFKRPWPLACTVGNTYRAVAGDDNTGNTCQFKFNNKRRFRGFEYVPGMNAVYQSPIHL